MATGSTRRPTDLSTVELTTQIDSVFDRINRLQHDLGKANLSEKGFKMPSRRYKEWRTKALDELADLQLEYRQLNRELTTRKER